MNASLSELVRQVRRGIDEVTMSGELVITDQDGQETASSNFSDEDLLDRLLDGSRYIVARVGSVHLSSFMGEVQPASDTLSYEGPFPPYRGLGSRTTGDEGVPATRRTFSAHRKLNASGREVTEQNPVFIYEDAHLVILPEHDPSTASDDYKMDAVFGPADYDDITKLSDKFREALIQYALSSCFLTLRNGELASAAKQRMFNIIGPYMIRRYDQQEE